MINKHNIPDKIDFREGVSMLVDKPISWTSFDLVKKLKFALNIPKVGHAGTLDPLASGLMIICTGKMTKKIHTFQDMEKTYEGTFLLGVETPSYDFETEVIKRSPTEHLNDDIIKAAAQKLTGDISQKPPKYSAVKVKGERMYELARRGEEVEIKERTVHVKAFEITEINLPEVKFRIICSKGTYIRSLAHDFGRLLESGACLKSLSRTAIGDYLLKEALSVEEACEKLQR